MTVKQIYGIYDLVGPKEQNSRKFHLHFWDLTQSLHPIVLLIVVFIFLFAPSKVMKKTKYVSIECEFSFGQFRSDLCCLPKQKQI